MVSGEDILACVGFVWYVPAECPELCPRDLLWELKVLAVQRNGVVGGCVCACARGGVGGWGWGWW